MPYPVITTALLGVIRLPAPSWASVGVGTTAASNAMTAKGRVRLITSLATVFMASSCGIGLVRDDGLAKDRDVEFALMMDLIDLDLKMDLVEAGLREESESLVLAHDLFYENECGLISIRMMELGVHLHTSHFLTRSRLIKLVNRQVDVCLAALRDAAAMRRILVERNQGVSA